MCVQCCCSAIQIWSGWRKRRGVCVRQLPARPCLQVLRKQREKDAELARVRAEREAEAALRALERKLQLQDKVRRRGGARCLPRGQRVHLYIT